MMTLRQQAMENLEAEIAECKVQLSQVDSESWAGEWMAAAGNQLMDEHIELQDMTDAEYEETLEGD